VGPPPRGQFEVSRDYIHLSSFFLASHPRPVREAIERHRRAIDDNPFLYVERHMFEMPGHIRAAAAEYLGGRPEEVALTNSTTMGLAFVYQGLPVKAGQEILTTTHDHFVHHEAIRLAAERAGASVRKIPLYDDLDSVSEEEIVRRIRRAVGPQTRAVGVTWVHSGSGLKVPVRRVAETLAEVNAGRAEAERVLLIVDGVHGLGVEDETVARMGCDFFIAGTHKWVFGPRGTGLVWAKAESWNAMRPIFPAFEFGPFTAWLRGGTPPAMEASWVSPGGFQAFEYLWALPAAFAFHRQLGRSRVAGRIHSLNEQCKEGLARMRHVKLHTPRGHKMSAGLVCFDVEGMKPEEVVARLLARRIVASVSPYAAPCARLAPSLLNTPEEIDTTLREVRALAAA
jgi:isopenicillin-N epimerase